MNDTRSIIVIEHADIWKKQSLLMQCKYRFRATNLRYIFLPVVLEGGYGDSKRKSYQCKVEMQKTFRGPLGSHVPIIRLDTNAEILLS
jgi:hypothetical protein